MRWFRAGWGQGRVDCDPRRTLLITALRQPGVGTPVSTDCAKTGCVSCSTRISPR
ncbi:2Fe-2S iron-sulfur cluster-binding protein [Mycolicibacterium stellerae]|uniref:2Fe-2S iron-sulfur cluster-binding protein n=1 Tax=Mycolicibacterium stellerae TaxID=2358193 RepID=UPI000F0B96E6